MLSLDLGPPLAVGKWGIANQIQYLGKGLLVYSSQYCCGGCVCKQKR